MKLKGRSPNEVVESLLDLELKGMISRSQGTVKLASKGSLSILSMLTTTSIYVIRDEFLEVPELILTGKEFKVNVKSIDKELRLKLPIREERREKGSYSN